MPRAKKDKDKGYFKAFPSRLRSLMEEQKITQAQLSKAINKSAPSISLYCDGSVSPDWETIILIADYCGVSLDYLLGVSDYRSRDLDLQAVCEYTGLSEQAVTQVSRMKDGDSTGNLISSLPTENGVQFNPKTYLDIVLKDGSIQRLLGALQAVDESVNMVNTANEKVFRYLESSGAVKVVEAPEGTKIYKQESEMINLHRQLAKPEEEILDTPAAMQALSVDDKRAVKNAVRNLKLALYELTEEVKDIADNNFSWWKALNGAEELLIEWEEM